MRGVVQKVNQYGDAGEQVVEISFITEGDVYRLIVHSKLPSAERFEHWVFDEVLPSIRKHGVYMSDSILDQVIQHPEVIYTLAQELVAEREQLEGIRKQLDLQVGFYTEMMFPKKNVRFIAVNNGVDSANPTDNDFTPFLNIMNEWYAKDTSKKIKAVFKARMRDELQCEKNNTDDKKELLEISGFSWQYHFCPE